MGARGALTKFGRRAWAAATGTFHPHPYAPLDGRRARSPRARWVHYVVPGAAVVAVVLPAAVISSQGLNQIELDLPFAAAALGYSFLRMIFAYLLALGFALVYGYYAATNRTAERVLLPVLDVLQSVPILGFVPLVLVVFINVLPAQIGGNLAVIFLVFTSMAWNMAFGVYESIKGIPTDLREATDSFGARGTQRWRALFLPSTVNRLVYNSVLSWTAGWFYLVSSEIISTGTGASEAIFGIGSFLAAAAAPPADWNALTAGLILLAALIVLMDVFVWRPAGRWAERFRYDTAPSGDDNVPSTRRTGDVVGRAVRLVTRGVTRGVARGARGGYAILRAPFESISPSAPSTGRVVRPRPRLRSAVRYVILGTALVAVWLLLIYISVAIYSVFTQPTPPSAELQQIAMIPAALASSAARLFAAYLLCVLIAVPLAIYLARHARAARFGLPVVEVVASFPATALFPLFVIALPAVVGKQFTAILLLMTGMIWYLFFNALSGVRSLPPDLNEASKSFGANRREYYRRVLLPAMFPALVTGSITAVGGGWNALIVAEYVSNPYSNVQPPQPLFQVLGLGQLINLATWTSPAEPALLAASLLTLVLVVVVVNEVLWKPLYRRTVDRYRMD